MNVLRSSAALFTMATALAFFPSAMRGQGSCGAATAGVATRSAAAQPSIIVIPFTRQGEDMRTVFEADFGRQAAIAAVKQAFDNLHFPTRDLLGTMRMVSRGQAMGQMSEQDFRDRVLEQSQADIFVTANIQPRTTQPGQMTVNVILDAYLTANGMALGTEQGSSNDSRLMDTTAHVVQAMRKVAPPLLDKLQRNFCEFQEEGIPLSVEFRVASGASHDLQSGISGQKGNLSDLLEEWLKQQAFKESYRLGNSSRTLLQFSDVRIAMRDARGAPASPRRFASAIQAYLRTLGIESTTTMTNGAIYVDVK